MVFRRISPPEELKNIVECYWFAENSDPTPIVEKIIPDGFTEIIFHYRDPYRIRLKNTWELQSKNLVAGQIRRHFFLQNTGLAGVIGIKLKPTALTQLYGISQNVLTDRVVDLIDIPELYKGVPKKELLFTNDQEERINILNKYFGAMVSRYKHGMADKAIEMVFAANGMLSVSDITSTLFVTERQLERIFKTSIGLSPKFYCRIIRFNHIFQYMQKENTKWADVFYNAGFYDQSHFIRNFKAFTGEEPSSYLFEMNNLANFFLKKSNE
jgi:AraC-like DNA-binding protein